jgi:hypothetical protein
MHSDLPVGIACRSVRSARTVDAAALTLWVQFTPERRVVE